MANLTISDDMSINANSRFSGYLTVESGSALTKGMFLMINSDSEAMPATVDKTVVGVCVLDAADGAPVTIFGNGAHIVDYVASGLTAGSPIYLANGAAGVVTQDKTAVAGSAVYPVAIAVSETDIMVAIGQATTVAAE